MCMEAVYSYNEWCHGNVRPGCQRVVAETMKDLMENEGDLTVGSEVWGVTRGAYAEYAIIACHLVGLAQFGVSCIRADITGVDILHPWVFTGMLFGAMMPYAFGAPAPVVEYIAPAPAVLLHRNRRNL